MQENPLTPKLILLGAGASVPAGVPAAKPMFDKIYATLKAEQLFWNLTGPAINLAIAGIQFRNATVDQSPLNQIDIEELYAILRDLANRNLNSLAPFVGSWSQELISVENPNLVGFGNMLADMLELDLYEGINNSFKSARSRDISLPKFRKALDSTLRVIGGEGASNSFINACDAILSLIVSSVWIKDENQVNYLKPLIDSSLKKNLWIASLNYDNAIELAAGKAGISVDLGITKNKAGALFLNNRHISLAKLHGSVDWEITKDLTVDIKGSPINRPALIFGAGNKLKVEGPYLDLLLSFRNQLNVSNHLDVYGYSFRDAHVNHLILSWLSQNDEGSIDVVDPSISKEEIFANINKGLEGGQRIRSELIEKRIEVNRCCIQDWILQKYPA